MTNQEWRLSGRQMNAYFEPQAGLQALLLVLQQPDQKQSLASHIPLIMGRIQISSHVLSRAILIIYLSSLSISVQCGSNIGEGKMRILFIIIAISGALIFSGCETAAQRQAMIHQASTAKICDAIGQAPQYANELLAELRSRGESCDWDRVSAIGQQHQAAVSQEQARQQAFQQQQQQIFQTQMQAIRQSEPNVQSQQSVMTNTSVRGVTATWTGRSEYGTSVTSLPAVNCEYMYAGQRIWKAFQSSCPSTIQVQ